MRTAPEARSATLRKAQTDLSDLEGISDSKERKLDWDESVFETARGCSVTETGNAPMQGSPEGIQSKKEKARRRAQANFRNEENELVATGAERVKLPGCKRRVSEIRTNDDELAECQKSEDDVKR